MEEILVPEPGMVGSADVAVIEGVGQRLKHFFRLAGFDQVHFGQNAQAVTVFCAQDARLRRRRRVGGYNRLVNLAITVVKRVQNSQEVVQNELDSPYTCPLSFTWFKDPVITPCGHTYERSFVRTWLDNSPTDPMSRRPLAVHQIIPNIAMRNATKLYRVHHRKFSIMC